VGRQGNFSRTCWITFHWRGIDSSVSVTVSPNLRSRLPPQQRQVVGPGTILTRQMLRHDHRADAADAVRHSRSGVWSIAFIPIVLIVPPTELQWPANSGLGQYS
jgi:hypothetical protein